MCPFKSLSLFQILLCLQGSFTEGCTDGSITANPDDCATYLQCNHGQALVRPCPSGLLFNSKITACDWPQNVVCETNGGSSTSTTTPTTTTSRTTTAPAPTTSSSTTGCTTTKRTTTQRPTTTTQSSTTSVSPTPTSGPPSGSIRFAPYFDTNLQGPKLTDIYAQTGQKDFMLAFAIGSSEGCVPKWGGQVDLNDPSVIGPIRALQAQGGQFVVATGGAMGPYFEQLCTTVDTLAAAYMKVLDTVNTNNLDIDIESTVNADLVNQALAKVQQQRPSTIVSYTLMVQAEDYGLTPQLGVDILTNAKTNGVRVDFVNPMTMEFGGPSSDFGDSVINAATSVVGQMKQIWPEKGEPALYSMLSVTPMIGRNFNGKIFTQDHARKLVAWAKQHGVGRLHFWSIGRDHGSCAGGAVSPTCSSIAQAEYEFTTIFQGF